MCLGARDSSILHISKIAKLSRELQEDYKGCSTQGAEWIKNIQISCKGLLFSNRTITVCCFDLTMLRVDQNVQPYISVGMS